MCSVQVSVSVRPERLSAAGTTRDTGHHSRFVPRSCCWPPRHAALASMALAAASRSIGLSHSPRLGGAPGGAMADMARGERAVADRVARSAVLTRGEPVTWGGHLRLPAVSPGALGQHARRHYWLAPRSDDAVGAAGMRISSRALARLQQLDIGCLSPLRFGWPVSAAQQAVGRCRDAGWGRAGGCRARSLTGISTPFGCRVSGDEAGDCARASRQGRCGDGHQPG